MYEFRHKSNLSIATADFATVTNLLFIFVVCPIAQYRSFPEWLDVIAIVHALVITHSMHMNMFEKYELNVRISSNYYALGEDIKFGAGNFFNLILVLLVYPFFLITDVSMYQEIFYIIHAFYLGYRIHTQRKEIMYLKQVLSESPHSRDKHEDKIEKIMKKARNWKNKGYPKNFPPKE